MIALMMQFGPDKLFEEFAEQYIIEYGTNKLQKIASIVRDSDKITMYIQGKAMNVDLPAKLTTPRRFILTTLRRCNLTTHF